MFICFVRETELLIHMEQKLDITNPEQLIYQNQLLKMTALGGIKLEGLDRMRVTLKIGLVDSSVPPVRHNLDLYNDNQLEKLVRKVAERLEVGTKVVMACLSELTNQLEQYRLQRIKENQPEMYKSPTLTADERKAAEDFLKSTNLLERTNQLIGKSGVVGEIDNRLIMYLIFTSRKQTTPLHIVSLGASGVGKTHLQEKVGQLIPEEDTLSVTSLSENSFYYFGQKELKNKLILIEDLDGVGSNAGSQGGGAFYALRELQSKKRISKTVARKNAQGETRSVHLIVEGPVSVAGCTTKEQIYEDNANRSFLINLDESQQQTDLIMDYQRTEAAGLVDYKTQEEAAKLLRNCQRILEPIKVVNPYAQQLKIPGEVFKPRRTNSHYLQFIGLITFYHQFQRTQRVDKETGEVYIETNLEDIAEANKLMKHILLRKSDELTGACRNYFELLKAWLKDQQKIDQPTSQPTFTNAEARAALRENHSNQKRYMIQLQQSGLVRKVKGDKKKGFYYEIISLDEYEKLKEGIAGVLDNIYQTLVENERKQAKKSSKPSKQPTRQPNKEVQGSQEVQLLSEPLQPKRSRKSKQKFTETEKV